MSIRQHTAGNVFIQVIQRLPEFFVNVAFFEYLFFV